MAAMRRPSGARSMSMGGPSASTRERPPKGRKRPTGCAKIFIYGAAGGLCRDADCQGHPGPLCGLADLKHAAFRNRGPRSIRLSLPQQHALQTGAAATKLRPPSPQLSAVFLRYVHQAAERVAAAGGARAHDSNRNAEDLGRGLVRDSALSKDTIRLMRITAYSIRDEFCASRQNWKNTKRRLMPNY
jgi:hypothetical protein